MLGSRLISLALAGFAAAAPAVKYTSTELAVEYCHVMLRKATV